MKPERIEGLMERARMVAGRCPAGSFVDVSLEPAELLHLLRCARAWAEIENEARAGLHEFNAAPCMDGRWEAQIVRNCEPLEWAKGPDLLTATEAALEKAMEQQ